MNTEITFESLNLSDDTLRALADMGFERPSSIQSAVIPTLLEGKDATAQAQTGTGKTAAFGIPIAELLNNKDDGVQALVLEPTRELALQVAGEINKICKYKGIRELAVYGGQSIDRQIKALKRDREVQVVVGTPGRIIDHIQRRTLKLNNIKIVVLDEADEMLDMGFIEDIERILENTPENRQTLMFSATMNDRARSIANKHMKNPVNVSIMPKQLTVEKISQYYYEVKDKYRFEALARILDVEDMGPTMIFCRTKKNVDDLVGDMQAVGYSVDAIHGDIVQTQRQRVIEKFKSGNIDFLVATDVAARGIDVEGVTHVINYNIPEDPESYVHRIGRTGRAGKEGIAFTLVTPREFKILTLIEKYTKGKIKRKEVPTIEDIKLQKAENIKNELAEIIQNENLTEYREIMVNMAEEYNLLDIAAASLQYIVKVTNKVDYDHDIEFSNSENERYRNDNFSEGRSRGRDRRDRHDRRDENKVRLFMNMGRKSNITPDFVVRTVGDDAGVSSKFIGSIDIYDDFTFFDIDKEYVDKVIQNLDNKKMKNKKLKVEKAKRSR